MNKNNESVIVERDSAIIITFRTMADDVEVPHKHLKDEYIFKFFKLLNFYYSRAEGEEKKMQFSIKHSRIKLGRTKYNGQKHWIFEMVLNVCLIAGILIQTDKHCTLKGESRKYMYSNDFNKNYAKNKKIYPDKVEISKDDNEYMKKPVFDIYESDYTEIYKEFLNRGRLGIEKDEAYKLIDNALEKNEFKSGTAAAATDDVNAIVNNYKYVTLGVTGRLFSNLTEMKRELRQFLTYDGRHFDSLDLKSSQPTIMMNMLRINGYDNSDIDKFKEVLKGDIYNYCIDRWNEIKDEEKYKKRRENEMKENGGVEIPVTREYMKKEMFRFIMKTGNKGEPSKAQIVIMLDFPGLYQALSELRNKYKDSNKTFAAELQGVEAKIFVPVFAKFCLRGCYIVHDGLFFLPELREELEAELKTSLENHGVIEYELKYDKNKRQNKLDKEFNYEIEHC